ncbi:unnamed protein product [Prunus armeniaca]
MIFHIELKEKHMFINHRVKYGDLSLFYKSSSFDKSDAPSSLLGESDAFSTPSSLLDVSDAFGTPPKAYGKLLVAPTAAPSLRQQLPSFPSLRQKPLKLVAAAPSLRHQLPAYGGSSFNAYRSSNTALPKRHPIGDTCPVPLLKVMPNGTSKRHIFHSSANATCRTTPMENPLTSSAYANY